MQVRFQTPTSLASTRRVLRRLGGLAGALLLAVVLAWPATAPTAAGQDLQQDDTFNKGGRTAFQFLKIGLGARQAGLGEASIAAVQDVNAVFWNPAGLRGLTGVETSFSYVNWLADLNYVAGVIGARWQPVGVVAFSIASLDYGTIDEALVSGGGDTRTGQTFSGSDLLVGATFAREFTDRLALGVGVKFLRESLFDYAVNSIAFDVGTNYHIGYHGTRLAMSAQNFSGSVRWLGDESDRQEGYDIPLVFRIGVSTNLIGSDAFLNLGPLHQVTVSAEAINTNDYSERLHVGAEYAFSELLMLRGGYRMNYAEGNLSLGVGLAPSVSGIELRVDYAYVAYEYLNAPHRVTLVLAF
jgi:hypothetical protein